MQPGTFFLSGFEGTTVPPLVETLLRDRGLSGVVLFRRNIASYEQLKELNAAVRELAGRPVLIAVDHEGGRVFRMPPPFTKIPPMADVGAYDQAHADGEAHAFHLANLMGSELRAAGFNGNFAPVLDLNTNPKNPIIGDRAFGPDQQTVARLGVAMIRGFQESGILCCGKHFPGHGDTDLDSHRALPQCPHTLERLRWAELVPFRAAIAAGVPMIMTAHILYGALDAAQPVTFSKRAITSLLREELAFPGVIVTDDLEMGATRALATPEEGALRSLQAGCDLAIICRDTHATARAIDRVEQALSCGELPQGPLEASANRIKSLICSTP
jgi:beta-N-acetylhexosaminidase